ncbi:iron transporter, partial [Streptomyces sp. SID9944]|nr:iron transporter [Streptomyces sp. SID9944]
MTTAPPPHGHPTPPQDPHDPADTVPRQATRSPHLQGPDDHRGTDLLDHPDPHTAAQAAGVENLLRCWVRETGAAAPDGDVLRIPLPASGTALLVPVRHWSPTGWHRFGLP